MEELTTRASVRCDKHRIFRCERWQRERPGGVICVRVEVHLLWLAREFERAIGGYWFCESIEEGAAQGYSVHEEVWQIFRCLSRTDVTSDRAVVAVWIPSRP
jgi:hypothetical protein